MRGTGHLIPLRMFVPVLLKALHIFYRKLQTTGKKLSPDIDCAEHRLVQNSTATHASTYEDMQRAVHESDAPS